MKIICYISAIYKIIITEVTLSVHRKRLLMKKLWYDMVMMTMIIKLCI